MLVFGNFFLVEDDLELRLKLCIKPKNMSHENNHFIFILILSFTPLDYFPHRVSNHSLFSTVGSLLNNFFCKHTCICVLVKSENTHWLFYLNFLLLFCVNSWNKTVHTPEPRLFLKDSEVKWRSADPDVHTLNPIISSKHLETFPPSYAKLKPN